MITKMILILTLAAAPTYAANYFVRTDGSDTCNGSVNAAASSAPNCAYLTIQKSITVAKAGDVVVIQPGNYSGAVNFSKAGTASAPITFSASGVVLKANTTFSGSYTVVDGMTFSPTSAGGYSAVELGGQNNTAKNCAVLNYGASASDQATAITLSGSFNTVDHCTIKDLNDIDVFHVFGHDQTIRNNTLTNISQVHYDLNHTDFFQTWGYNGALSYNILIEGNTVTNSSCQLGNTSIDGQSGLHDWTFRNNVFANIGASFFWGVPKGKFYNNIFYNVGAAQGYAISLYNMTGYSAAGAEFINNIFLNNGEDVNFHNGNASDVVVFKNNYFGGGTTGTAKKNQALGTDFINGGSPGFTNAGNLDFHLRAGSPLIGKGLVVSSFMNDKDGQGRASTWDIGPYSFKATTSSASMAAPKNLRIIP